MNTTDDVDEDVEEEEEPPFSFFFKCCHLISCDNPKKTKYLLRKNEEAYL